MLACGISQVRIAIPDLEEFLQKVHGISSRRGTHVIFFNAQHIAGRAHAESALRHAFRALEQETMISNRVEMEALLYAAGSRQIVQGMKFGLQPGENAAYLCICPDDGPTRKDIMEFCDPAENEDWEVIPPEKSAHLCTLFSITPQEVEVVGRGRLPELVLERVALLEVYR